MPPLSAPRPPPPLFSSRSQKRPPESRLHLPRFHLCPRVPPPGPRSLAAALPGAQGGCGLPQVRFKMPACPSLAPPPRPAPHLGPRTPGPLLLPPSLGFDTLAFPSLVPPPCPCSPEAPLCRLVLNRWLVPGTVPRPFPRPRTGLSRGPVGGELQASRGAVGEGGLSCL